MIDRPARATPALVAAATAGHTRRVIAIRPAHPRDAPRLSEIYRAASLGNPGDRAALLAHPAALRWDATLITRAHVVAAHDGDAVLGFATALAGAPAWELEDLFVDPAHQRRGAATALVAALAARAGEAGATALEVTANPHAHAFYLAAGFVDIGVAATPFGDARRMARRLA